MCNELVIKSLIEVISKFRKIVIVSHVNPDGDALGSTLALYFFIKKLGGDPVVIIPNDYPNFYAWMPGINDVIVYDIIDTIFRLPPNILQAIHNYDFTADFASATSSIHFLSPL